MVSNLTSCTRTSHTYLCRLLSGFQLIVSVYFDNHDWFQECYDSIYRRLQDRQRLWHCWQLLLNFLQVFGRDMLLYDVWLGRNMMLTTRTSRLLTTIWSSNAPGTFSLYCKYQNTASYIFCLSMLHYPVSSVMKTRSVSSISVANIVAWANPSRQLSRWLIVLYISINAVHYSKT